MMISEIICIHSNRPVVLDEDGFERVLTRKERRGPQPSISDFPGVLRLPKRNYDVPTLDQLSRAEKLYLLRSYGYGCVEFEGKDALKIVQLVEDKFGVCRYFTAIRSGIVHARQLKKSMAAKKRADHEANQLAWKNGGQTAHYLNKYMFGNTEHAWFERRLRQTTGMTVVDTVVSACSWDHSEVQKVQRKSKWNRHSASSDSAQEGVYISRPAPVRSVMLLYKIRALIRALRADPTSVWQQAVEPLKTKWTVAMPQMEGQSGEEVGTIRTENVVLSEANPASSTVAAKNVFRFDWHPLCSTEKTVDYSHLEDRFTYFKTVEWTKEMPANTEIKDTKLDLPYDFVKSTTSDGSMPMFVPFKIHKYYKSDIEIKIHVNSNKFQVGQLQFSWQYMEKFDGNPLDNIYSRSQLPHVVVNAGASNEATLYIPWKFVQPYVHTSQRKNGIDCLYIGTLRTFVIAPLAVAEGGPDRCNYSIFIRFPNAQFTGMRDGSVVDPQMESAAAAMVATAVVNKFIGDTNCDNPTANVNPSYLVPTASHSWSAGTGLREQVHSLRLDNSTVGVGRPGVDNSETVISIPCRTFGMLKHVTWSIASASTNGPGTILFQCDVNAQLDKSLVYKINSQRGLNSYAMPPISNVASLHKQWRGGLEFKFDIIASQFHTGRLLCAYIPGVYGSATVTLAQARNSSHVEFSLQDSTSFTFVVPYISDRAFWPRKYTGPHKYNERASPSKLFLFVLNPLIPMQSVVDHVTIVPYVRAAMDFEVSVPVQPAIGLSDNVNNPINVKDLIYPTTGSYPYRATNYEGFGADLKYIFYEGTAAFGTASTFHAPEKELTKKEYYYGKAVNMASQPFITFKDDKGVKFQAKAQFIVLWNVPDKGNYGIPFPSGDVGEARANQVALGLKRADPVQTLLDLCYNFVLDSDNSSSKLEDLYFEPQYRELPNITLEDIGDLQMIDQREISTNVLMPNNDLMSTGSGSLLYNERFYDLKDLARRYQLYANKTIKIKKGMNLDTVLAVFPVIPHGLELDVSDSNSIFNPIRDGHIPIISSGYIFFRGSIRMRIVLSADKALVGGTKVWVQHHPDVDSNLRTIQVAPQITETDDFLSHTYGMYLQAMNINSIIEFEVPFYQSGIYGLTRKPKMCPLNSDLCTYYSLGNIIVGAFGGSADQAVDVSLQVFYSIGDDFSFNVFRGFPPVVYTDEVWPPALKKKKKNVVYITGEPQMAPIVNVDVATQLYALDREIKRLEKMAKDMLVKPGNSDQYTCIMKSLAVAQAERQRLSVIKVEVKEEPSKSRFNVFGNLKSKLKSALVSEVKEAAREAIVEEVRGEVSADISSLFNKAKTFAIDQPTVLTALGNLAHVIANPTPKTVAIAVANVIISLLCKTVINAVEFINKVISLVSKYWHRFVDEGLDVGQAQSGEDEQVKAQFASAIFTGVCAMGGLTLAPPGKFPDVLRNINSGVSLYNNVIRLVQNSGELITYCINYITHTFNPKSYYNSKLLSDLPTIKDWYLECNNLLDVRHASLYKYDRREVARVFHAAMVGETIVANSLSNSRTVNKIVSDTQRDIVKLRDTIASMGAHPDVRFEPFPLFMTGAPGIGKSFVSKKIITDLLSHINVKAGDRASAIYEIPSGAKYWNGVEEPYALISDDLFQVSGQRLEEEIAMIFQICSSSILNPPMASVEKKEKRLNPYIYLQLCNHAFPTLSPTCRTPSAVYRRRKFLIQARLRAQYDTPEFRDAESLPRDVLDKLGHLEFLFADNVVDPSTTYSNPMPYEEMIDKLKVAFKISHENEWKNFGRRMMELYGMNNPNFEEDAVFSEMPRLDPRLPLEEQIQMRADHYESKIREINNPSRDPQIHDLVTKLRFKWNKFWADRRGEIVDPQMNDKNVLKFLNPTETLLERLKTWKADQWDWRQESMEETEMLYKFFQMITYNNSFVQSPKNFLPVMNSDDFNTAFQDIPLLHDDINCAHLSVNEYLSKYHQLNSTYFSGNTWYEKLIDNMMQQGDFKLFEKLRLLLLFKSNKSSVPALLLNLHVEDEAKFHVDVFDYFVSNGSSLTPLENSERERHLPRHGLAKSLSIESPIDIFFRHINDLRTHVIYWFVQRNPQVTTLFDRLVLLDKFLFEGDITIDNFFNKILMSFHMCNIESGQIEERYMRVLYGCAVLIYFLIFGPTLSPRHNCDKKNLVIQIAHNIHTVKFCSITHKLVVKDVVVDLCKDKYCIYSNSMLFYYLAGFAISCKQKGQATRNILGMCDNFKFYEVDDFSRALRYRQKHVITTWYSEIYYWLKDIVFHSIPKYLSGLWSVIKENLPRLLLVAGFTGLLSGTCAMLSGYQAVAPQGYSFKFETPKHPQISKPNIAGKNLARQQGFIEGEPQMSAQQYKQINKIIENNTIIVTAYRDNCGKQEERSCRCLMLRGRAMLILRHYFEEYRAMVQEDPSWRFKLTWAKGVSAEICQMDITYDDLVAQVAWCSNSDKLITSNFGIAILPKFVLQFKDITKFIATTHEHKNISAKGILVSIGEGTEELPIDVRKNFLVAGNGVSSQVVVERVYRYRKSYAGLCGSVLIDGNLGSGNGAIVGIHVAGQTSGWGYSEPLTRDLFTEFFNICPQPIVDEIELSQDPLDFKLNSNLLIYGTIPREFAQHQSGESKICPSLLANTVYPVRTEINPLAPNDPRQPPGSHPLRDGCNKHGTGNITTFSKENMDRVTENIIDNFQKIVVPVRAEIAPLTLQQAVCGDVNVPYFDAINWKSSEGFPLKRYRPTTAQDKRWLFEVEQGEFGLILKKIKQPLVDQLKYRNYCFQQNIKPITIYTDCLKDYRLTPEKCAMPGKTRVFSVAPIQCSLDVRMYINDFCASIKNNRIKNSIAIGINPDSMEWTSLVEYLFEPFVDTEPKIITLDYSNYGPCLMSQCVAASAEVIVEWYKFHGADTEHVKRVAWLLDSDIINPVHLSSNVVYQTLNGISSGSPLTGEMNSIPNLFYIKNTYLEITKDDPELNSLTVFDENVRIVVYGDDLIMSVSDKLIDKFNALTIRDCLATHGIKVTPAQKSSEMVAYTSIYDATFLKRSFTHHPTRPGVWLAPIDKASIEEVLNWCHVSDDLQEATLECCRASLDLAYSHGPEYFKEHYNKIKTALAELHLSVPYKPWFERDREIFGDSGNNPFQNYKFQTKVGKHWFVQTNPKSWLS